MDHLKPAPGRIIVRLSPSWTAVILEPLRGRPYRAIALFHSGNLERVMNAPGEVRRVLRAIQSGGTESRCVVKACVPVVERRH